jgi:hypothetical protein
MVTHPLFITLRYYVKGWVKPDADAGSKFEADPQKGENSHFHGNIGIFETNIGRKAFYIAISQYYLQYLIDVNKYCVAISVF